jgi:hypothetical protein
MGTDWTSRRGRRGRDVSDEAPATGDAVAPANAEGVVRLFKYLPPRRIDVLRTTRVCFSRPSTLNDIFELQPVFEHLGSPAHVKGVLTREQWEVNLDKHTEEAFARRRPEERGGMTLEEAKARMRQLAGSYEDVAGQVHEIVESNKADVGAEVLARLDRTVGVFCLSEIPTNLLMWALYAQRHEGFLLEFDSGHSFFHQRHGRNGEFGTVMSVEYGTRPKTLMVEATMGELFFTKSAEWSYEREWRIVLPLERATESKPTKHGAAPVHLFAFPPDSLVSVVLGCRMSDKAAVLDALRANEALQHVRRRRAVQDPGEYRVYIEDLPDDQ